MTKIIKAKKWWASLSVLIKAKILENNSGILASNNCNQWWHLCINDKEKIQIYEDFNLIKKEVSQ